MPLTVIQLVPALNAGGVERGTVEVAGALVQAGHRAIVVSAGGRLVEAVEGAGARHVRLDIGRKSPLVLSGLPALRQIIEESGAHIVHARSRLPAWLGLMALRMIPAGRRPRFVTSVHGPYTVNAYSGVMVRGERVIAISDFIRDYIVRNYPGVSASRIRVIPRGVDAAQFPHGYRPGREWRERWYREFPQLKGRVVVTLPARITRWKGQADFLRLIGKLRARRRDVHGLIVGGVERRQRPFLQELEAFVARTGLEDAVTFAGHRDDPREVLSVSSLVVSLSLEPEAFGRTSLEALSLGVPVVAYDHGGAGEVLRQILPQGLVPVGDVKAAAARAAAFLDQPPQVPSGHSFTLERMLAKTLSVYEELA
jgi:glycosyltransferase involved in cell wall biosynthesis